MKKPLFFTAFLFSFLHLFAQQQWVNFTNGLTIIDVIQQDDLLWVATTGGLVKIDQSTDQTTFYNRGNSHIPSNNVLDIQLDAQEQLWVSTDLGTGMLDGNNWELFYDVSGLIRLNPEGQIVVVDQKSVSTWNGVFFDVENIIEVFHDLNDCQINQENGEIWWTYSAYGQYSIYHHNNDLELLEYNDDNTSLPSFSVSLNPLVIDDQGTVWTGNDCGLFRFEDGEWLNLSDAGYPIGSYNYVGKDNNGDIWSALSTFSYCNFIDDTPINYLVKTSENGSFQQFEIPYDISVNGAIRFVDFVDNETPYIYIGTTKNGLWKYDFSEWTFINTSIPNPINNKVLQVFVDGENSYVFSGINSTSSDFKMTFLNSEEWIDYNENNPLIDITEGLPQRFIGRHLNTLWAYADDKLLAYVDGDWSFPEMPDILEDVDESDAFIYNAPYGDKWILEKHQSYLFYKQPHKDWQVFPHEQHGAVSGHYDTFFTDPNTGYFWLSSINGLSYFDKENWHIIDVSNCGQYPGVNDLEVDENGVIWGVTNNSVFTINKDTAVIIPTDEFVVDLEHILLTDTPYFSNVEIDENGSIWVSHKRGIARFDDGEWVMLNHKNSGVPNGRIGSFKIDENNNFWLGSYSGGLAIYNSDGLPDYLANSMFTSVESIDERGLISSIVAFPNPVLKNQAITFDLKNIEQAQKLTVSVYNLQGQIVLQKYVSANQDKLLINGLPQAGIYFLQVQSPTTITTTKFVVE